MARRRMYVFGTIIVIGVLVGFFCLPNTSDRLAGEQQNTAVQPPAPPNPPPLPQADIANTPAARAETLVSQARSLTDTQQKAIRLVEAYRIDHAGRWGGEAAAEIGLLCKATDSAKAKQWFLAAKQTPVSPETLAKIDAELEAINTPLPTPTPAPTPAPTAATMKMLQYKVQANDNLWVIAKRHAVTPDAIMKANNLTTNAIRVDKTLNVPQGPFDVLVTKSKHTLQVLQNGQAVKVYGVALGANNSTPIGSFTVTSKLVNPVWYSEKGRIPPGDPNNLLGSRWIGFNGAIGIHGTRKCDENTIGTDASQGCVRMRDDDVKELYTFLVEGKSKVTVAE